jgi:hypothetical protein
MGLEKGKKEKKQVINKKGQKKCNKEVIKAKVRDKSQVLLIGDSYQPGRWLGHRAARKGQSMNTFHVRMRRAILSAQHNALTISYGLRKLEVTLSRSNECLACDSLLT